MLTGITLAGLNIQYTSSLHAQKIIPLSLESAVEMAMKNSYRIKQLELGIEETRYWLRSERAALKSRVYMNLRTPDFNALSEYKWNSTIEKDEIVYLNTRLWQMDLAVKQPVILMGYPTNGYLSLNNRVYRYFQKSDIDRNVNYYNRFFALFEQPILLPNELRNEIEEAELNLEQRELEYLSDRVYLIEDIAYRYNNLFRLTYNNEIYSHKLKNLEKLLDITINISQQDTTRNIEGARVELELANAREIVLKNQNETRYQAMLIKQRLGLSDQDSLHVEPVVNITPVVVNPDEALHYGFSLRPRLRLLGIEKRKREIRLENVKGNNSFHLNLEVTLGLEKQEDHYQAMWDKYNNSYSVSVSAYVPIWDWGRRTLNVEAEKVNVRRAELNIEETEESIRNEIMNTITNLQDYQQRALNLAENLKTAQEIIDISISQYRENKLSLQGILQIIERQKDTELNFIDAYLGYRRSLISLMADTFYDYENDISLSDKFQSAE